MGTASLSYSDRCSGKSVGDACECPPGDDTCDENEITWCMKNSGPKSMNETAVSQKVVAILREAGASPEDLVPSKWLAALSSLSALAAARYDQEQIAMVRSISHHLSSKYVTKESLDFVNAQLKDYQLPEDSDRYVLKSLLHGFQRGGYVTLESLVRWIFYNIHHGIWSHLAAAAWIYRMSYKAIRTGRDNIEVLRKLARKVARESISCETTSACQCQPYTCSTGGGASCKTCQAAAGAYHPETDCTTCNSGYGLSRSPNAWYHTCEALG